MATSDNPILLEVTSFLDSCFKQSKNSLILTIPGLGLSHLLKQYCQEGQATYINDPSLPASNRNIVDFDFQKHPNSLNLADNYYKNNRTISPKNTFIFIINSPSVINSSLFSKSYLASHVYDFFWFHPWSEFELADFAHENQVNLSTSQLSRLYRLSGGIIRLAKYLLFHPEILDLADFSILQNNDEFIKLMQPTFDILASTSTELLCKLNLYQDSRYTGTIVNWFFDQNIIKPKLGANIILSPDLTFTENGQTSDQVLTKFEADLLDYLLSHQYLATRDQISEVKWGKDSFEKFSDQAINKAISRLNDKLKHHQIKSIPKVGYKLITHHA